MRFRLLYLYRTKLGPFYIGQSEDGRFHPIFNGESLGSYSRADQAAEDLAGGHTFTPYGGQNIRDIGIPYDLEEWEAVVTR